MLKMSKGNKIVAYLFGDLKQNRYLCTDKSSLTL